MCIAMKSKSIFSDLHNFAHLIHDDESAVASSKIEKNVKEF